MGYGIKSRRGKSYWECSRYVYYSYMDCQNTKSHEFKPGNTEGSIPGINSRMYISNTGNRPRY